MSGWLYLIRNRDLYKIGITKNLKNRMRQLKPDNVVAKLYTSDFLKLERELHKRYKKYRIPQTEYFRLENRHLREIKQRISHLNYPVDMFLMVFMKSLLTIIVVYFLMLIVMYLNFNGMTIIIHKSLLWMERILFGYSFLSLFVDSGKYLSFLSELKYRFLKLIVFIIFAFFFRIASSLLQ